jgi:hypothetical protein
VDTAQIRRRIGLEILIFAILISGTALVVKPVEAYTRAMMVRLRDYLVGETEEILNRTIRYASARPSIVGSLDIQDVSVYALESEPVLKLDRFRAEYSVFALLTGKKTGAIRFISLDGLEFTYDLDNDRDLAELFTYNEEKPPSFALPEKCRLELRRSAVLVKKGGQSLAVTGLYFDGQVAEGRILFDGNWHTELGLTGFGGSFNSVAVDGGLVGDFTRDFSDGNFSLSVSALRGDTFELGNLFFDFSIHDNVVELKDSGEENFGILLAYDLDTAIFSGEFRPENFVPGEILRLSGDWERYDPWLAMTLSGSASFSTGVDGLEYHFDLRGNGVPKTLPALDFTGSGSDEKIVFDRLYLAFSRGTLGFSGDLQFDPLIPEGILRFEDFSLEEGPGLDGELRFTRSGRELDIFSENFSSGGVAFSAVSGGMNWEESGCAYALELFRFKNIESYEDVRFSSVAVKGSFDWDPGRLEGSVALDAFSVADITAMVKPFYRQDFIPVLVEDFVEDIAVTTEIFISTDFEHISYNAPSCVAVHEGFSDIFTISSISGTDSRFEISNGRIGWKNGSADITLRADFSDLNNVSFSVQAAHRDFAYYFDGIFFDRRTLSIRGSYGISVYVAAAESGGYSGYIDIVSAPIPFRGRSARLGVDAALRFDSVSSWNLDISRLEFRENENPALQFTSLIVSGTANQDGAYIEKISYEDRLGKLSGSIQADWEQDFSTVWGRLLLLGEGENYILEAAYRDEGGASLRSGKTGRVAFGLQLAGVQIDRFMYGGRNVRLSGTLDGVWNGPNSYEISMNMESLQIPGRTMPILVSARGLINQDRLDIQGAEARIGGLGVKSSVFTLDRSRAVFEMSAEFGGAIQGREIGLEMSLHASFAPVDNWFGIAGALNTFRGSLDVESAYVEALRLPEPCKFEFSRIEENNSGMVTRISGGPGDMLRFELLGDGGLYMDLANPSPVQVSLTGTLKDFIIDAYSDEVFIDLPTAWALIPTDKVIVFTAGFITGKTSISGSIFDPEFSGSAWGSGVRLRLPQFIPEEIGSSSGLITLSENEVSFGPLKAACGEGEGEVTVSVRFNRWIPTCDIDVRVPEQSPIPFSFDLSGVKAGGSVSGNMRFVIENSETLFITGTLGAENTVITLDAEEISALRDGIDRVTDLDVVIDLGVNAGRRVEFLWPNEDFPVLRAYGVPGTGLRVAADTRIPQFTLNGDVLLQGGEIYYFQRSFFIREGQVFFNPNDPRIDPVINARAEIRERNDEGPVIISMIVDNAPLSSLTPRFESNPPLSQLEIYGLLGQIPEEGQESEVVLRTVTEALTQFAVIRRVERQIRDILGLDMFTVRIQVLQNALLQVMNNDPEKQRSGALGNYLDNTAVYMGKYIGSDLFIQAIIAMRYDQYRVENGGLWFEPDIGLDLRTPLVDIRWNLSPRHPEHLYVSDQSFSLSWRWSF